LSQVNQTTERDQGRARSLTFTPKTKSLACAGEPWPKQDSARPILPNQTQLAEKLGCGSLDTELAKLTVTFKVDSMPIK